MANDNGKKSGKFDIYILQVGSEYRVRPAVALIDAGRHSGQNLTLDVCNLTDWPVFLMLPDGVLDNANVVHVKEHKNASPQLKGQIAGAPSKAFHYSVAVVTTAGTVLAKGESDPVIIIDP
jgi:hypothetical protein